MILERVVNDVCKDQKEEEVEKNGFPKRVQIIVNFPFGKSH